MRYLLLALLLFVAPASAATLVHGRMIQDGSVATVDIADNAITAAKLSAADTAASRAKIEAAGFNVANTFAATQTILSTDAGASEGPLLDVQRSTATPAANDELGVVRFRGVDDALAPFNAGVIGARLVDPVAGSKDAMLTFATMIANSLATRFQMGAGLMYQGGADPGAGAVNATSYQRAGVTLPLQVAYASAGQVLTAGGALTLAHGLAAAPTLVQLRLVCGTAELGYSIADQVVVNPGTGPAVNLGVSVVVDATNVVLRYGSDAAIFHVNRKDTGATAAITPANWTLVVRAW